VAKRECDLLKEGLEKVSLLTCLARDFLLTYHMYIQQHPFKINSKIKRRFFSLYLFDT